MPRTPYHAGIFLHACDVCHASHVAIVPSHRASHWSSHCSTLHVHLRHPTIALLELITRPKFLPFLALATTMRHAPSWATTSASSHAAASGTATIVCSLLEERRRQKIR